MHGTIDDSIHIRDVMVPMRDGVRLATDVTLPAQGGVMLPGPFPTLLHRTPYDKSAARPSEISVANPIPKSNLDIAAGLARAGYAVLTQDCRGRYRSEGVFQKYIGEGDDGFDTLNWARDQDWCYGAFGTFGLSYSAHVQTALAVLDPPGLQAMFLDSGGFWNAYQGGVRRGGAFEMKQVTWAFRHACLSPVAKDPAIAAALKAEDISAWILAKDWRRGHSPLRHVPEYEDYLFDQWERGAFDDYWQKPELYAAPHYATLAKYKVFLISGWYDPYSETMFEHFKGVRAAGGHAELVMGPWLHGRRSQTFAGDVDFGTASVLDEQIAPDYATLRRDWFDRTLRGGTDQLSAPGTRWFCMGGGTGHRNPDKRRQHGGIWRNDPTWPPSVTRMQDFHLGASGTLGQSAPPEAEVTLISDPLNPVPTVGGAVTSGEPVMTGGAFDQVTHSGVFGATEPFGALAARPDVLVFATPPLTADIEIAGPVTLYLDVACDAPDADIAIKLVDWAPPNSDYPNGFAMILTESILRLRYRTDWTRPEFMPPDRRMSVTVAAPPVANLFRAGHRIRLDVSGSNFPKYDVNFHGTATIGKPAEAKTARTTLFLGGASNARLTLHVIKP